MEDLLHGLTDGESRFPHIFPDWLRSITARRTDGWRPSAQHSFSILTRHWGEHVSSRALFFAFRRETSERFRGILFQNRKKHFDAKRPNRPIGAQGYNTNVE